METVAVENVQRWQHYAPYTPKPTYFSFGPHIAHEPMCEPTASHPLSCAVHLQFVALNSNIFINQQQNCFIGFCFFLHLLLSASPCSARLSIHRAHYAICLAESKELIAVGTKCERKVVVAEAAFMFRLGEEAHQDVNKMLVNRHTRYVAQRAVAAATAAASSLTSFCECTSLCWFVHISSRPQTNIQALKTLVNNFFVHSF